MTKENLIDEIVSDMVLYISPESANRLRRVLITKFENINFENGNELATFNQTNEYYLKMFLTLKSGKLSDTTLKSYRLTITDFMRVINKPLDKVTSIDVEYYLSCKCCSESSLNSYRRNISAFFSWLVKKHYITFNPVDDVDAYKEIKKPIDHLEAEEMEMLKNGCKSPRDRALIEFMRCTGLRVSELINVKITDIDFNTGKVTVYGHKTKEWREVWLDKIALGYVRKYIASRGLNYYAEDFLFISKVEKRQMSAPAINRALKKIGESGGLDRRMYSHLLRKSVASTIVRRGGSVAEAGEYLGHKDNSVTAQHYAYRGEEFKKRIFDSYVAVV